MNRRDILALATSPLWQTVAQAQAPAAAPPTAARVVTTTHAAARLHSYISDASAAHVTAHVIEGPSGLVLVDGGWTPEAGREIRALVESLGKPLRAVLLSHFHPDHWAGLTAARYPEVLAGATTAALMQQVGAAMAAAQSQPTNVPRIEVQAPGALRLAGVDLVISYARDTEAPEIMTVEIPGASTLIVQDIFYNRVHAYVSRQLDTWLGVLAGLQSRGDVTFLVGHGEPATAREIPRLIGYLEAVRPLVATGTPDRAAIVAEMVRRFPDFAAPDLLALSLSHLPPG